MLILLQPYWTPCYNWNTSVMFILQVLWTCHPLCWIQCSFPQRYMASSLSSFLFTYLRTQWSKFQIKLQNRPTSQQINMSDSFNLPYLLCLPGTHHSNISFNWLVYIVYFSISSTKALLGQGLFRFFIAICQVLWTVPEI